MAHRAADFDTPAKGQTTDTQELLVGYLFN